MLENGSNFSVGQRQLFCLTRALLRKSRILVLDEATASVDFDTGALYSFPLHVSTAVDPLADVLIQKAIRSSFPNTTLLVIAHRLNTVMDMHKILGLADGVVQEYDSPPNLVKNMKVLLALSMHMERHSHGEFCLFLHV